MKLISMGSHIYAPPPLPDRLTPATQGSNGKEAVSARAAPAPHPAYQCGYTTPSPTQIWSGGPQPILVPWTLRLATAAAAADAVQHSRPQSRLPTAEGGATRRRVCGASHELAAALAISPEKIAGRVGRDGRMPSAPGGVMGETAPPVRGRTFPTRTIH